MRIGMLTSWFYPFPSGSANRFYEIARRLSREHEVHVYTTWSSSGGQEGYPDGFHVHRYGRIDPSQSLEKGVMVQNLKFSLSTLKRILRDVARERFDIIDCNITSKFLPFVSFLACRPFHIPLIETWHEVWHRHNLDKHNLFVAPAAIMAERAMPRVASYCIAVSNTTRQRLVHLLGVPSPKVAVIPNGVDVEAFARVKVRKEKSRIVYAGRLEDHKRVDLLLRAFKELKDILPESELFIAGNGSQRRNLMRLASDLDLKDAHFPGVIPKPDLIRLLKSSATLVLPSILEGQGVILLEAMAAGTPPIAVLSPESGVKDTVRHEFNGLLVQPKVKEIEEALLRLLTNESLYDQIRENGLGFVSRYDWDQIAIETSELYEQVARGWTGEGSNRASRAGT